MGQMLLPRMVIPMPMKNPMEMPDPSMEIGIIEKLLVYMA